MVRKNSRFWILVISCSAAGVILGAASSQAQIRQCINATSPTNECLMQDPLVETLEGMSFGLLAGAGAAVGATWQIIQKDSQ